MECLHWSEIFSFTRNCLICVRVKCVDGVYLHLYTNTSSDFVFHWIAFRFQISSRHFSIFHFLFFSKRNAFTNNVLNANRIVVSVKSFAILLNQFVSNNNHVDGSEHAKAIVTSIRTLIFNGKIFARSIFQSILKCWCKKETAKACYLCFFCILFELGHSELQKTNHKIHFDDIHSTKTRVHFKCDSVFWMWNSL